MIVKASEVLAIHMKYKNLTEYPAGTNNVIFNTRFYGHEVHDGDYEGSFYPWCVTFQRNGFDELDALEMFCRADLDSNVTASCEYVEEWAKAHGMWISNPADFRLGDMPIFNWNGAANEFDHIGFVISNDGVLHTIEGNTSQDGSQSNGGQVCLKDRPYSVCNGAFRPNYAPEEEEDDMAKIIEQIAQEANVTQEQAVAALVNYVKYANITADPWETTAVQKLKADGVISGDHAGNAPVFWGELAVVADKLHNEKQ